MPGAGPILDFGRSGRNPRTALAVATVWAGIGALWAGLSASPAILALLALATLPALHDLWAAPRAGLRIDGRTLSCFSGKRRIDLPLGEISHIRMDRRLDLSMRVSAVLRDGRKLRFPYESLPDSARLDAALTRAGLRVERHPFSLL